MIKIKATQTGNFNNITTFLGKMQGFNRKVDLSRYGQMGVDALSSATPVDTGKTAESWYYEIDKRNEKIILRWMNTNVNKGVNIAVILQYGHGTNNGGYVEGTDYINPALRPIFKKMADDMWKEVTSA